MLKMLLEKRVNVGEITGHIGYEIIAPGGMPEIPGHALYLSSLDHWVQIEPVKLAI